MTRILSRTICSALEAFMTDCDRKVRRITQTLNSRFQVMGNLKRTKASFTDRMSMGDSLFNGQTQYRLLSPQGSQTVHFLPYNWNEKRFSFSQFFWKSVTLVTDSKTRRMNPNDQGMPLESSKYAIEPSARM